MGHSEVSGRAADEPARSPDALRRLRSTEWDFTAIDAGAGIADFF
jgi:hypothetical protein